MSLTKEEETLQALLNRHKSSGGLIAHTLLQSRLKVMTSAQRYGLLNAASNDGIKAMCCIAADGNVQTVKCALSGMGGDQLFELLNPGDASRDSVLRRAIELGQAEAVRCMLNSLAEDQKYDLLKTCTVNDGTAIHLAACTQDSEILLCILDCVTADQKFHLLKMANGKGETALHLAALSGNTELVVEMLGHVTEGQREELLHITANDGISLYSLDIVYKGTPTDTREDADSPGAGSTPDEPRPKTSPSSQLKDDTSDSDISDGEGYIYPYDDPEKIKISLRTHATTKRRVKNLFRNHEKVYKMSSPIRGQALIINNKDFRISPRHGSEFDVFNMQEMLGQLRFEITTISDLTAEEMLTAISTVTRNPYHKRYGMFVLVIMSHGTVNDCIYGTDYPKTVKLGNIYDLLSTLNFPLMAQKPKLVIIQACSGDVEDRGNMGNSSQDPSTLSKPAVTNQMATAALEPDVSSAPTEMKAASTESNPQLNVDDLLVIKSSFEPYSSIRHVEFGSLFIRCLVTTFHKHAGNRDVITLFDIVQERVRNQTIKLARIVPDSCFGQVPVYLKFLTGRRKLYLFPGYEGNKRTEPKPKKPHIPSLSRKRNAKQSSSNEPLTSELPKKLRCCEERICERDAAAAHRNQIQNEHTELKSRFEEFVNADREGKGSLPSFTHDEQQKPESRDLQTTSKSSLAGLSREVKEMGTRQDNTAKEQDIRMSRLELGAKETTGNVSKLQNDMKTLTDNVSTIQDGQRGLTSSLSRLEEEVRKLGTVVERIVRGNQDLLLSLAKVEEEVGNLRNAVDGVHDSLQELDGFTCTRTQELRLILETLDRRIGSMYAVVGRIQDGQQALRDDNARRDMVQDNVQQQNNNLPIQELVNRIEDMALSILELQRRLRAVDGQRDAAQELERGAGAHSPNAGLEQGEQHDDDEAREVVIGAPVDAEDEEEELL